ncbi:MAG: hypothetical protein AB7U63_19385 [Porticoccaceae bacterium]
MENLSLMNREETQLSEQELEKLLQSEIQTSLENIDPRPPRVKLSRESQAFLLPDGSAQKTMEGVIVFHHKARGYWEVEGQQVPTCSSMDGRTGTDENGNTRPCNGCPHDAWGTGKDGRGKACKEMRWIYLLQEGEIIPSRISLPPTSLGKFDAFVTALAQKKLAPIQKVVRLSLEAAERHGYKFSALAQPEVIGDTPLKDIPGLIKMREAVVQAARKEGITAEDYYDEGAVNSDEQPY